MTHGDRSITVSGRTVEPDINNAAPAVFWLHDA